jgi:hypothetical protein
MCSVPSLQRSARYGALTERRGLGVNLLAIVFSLLPRQLILLMLPIVHRHRGDAFVPQYYLRLPTQSSRLFRGF